MPYVATIKMVFSVALPVFAALSFVFFGARHVNIFKSFQYFNSMAGFLAFFLGLITVLPQAHKLEKFAKNKTQSSLSSRNDANKNEEAETQLREAHNLVKDHHAVNGTCISEEALNNKIHKIISKPFKGSLKCEKNGWKFIYAFYIDSKNIFIINQDGFVLKNSKVYAMKLKGTKHGVKIEWKGK
jgi:predicted small secreted protein